MAECLRSKGAKQVGSYGKSIWRSSPPPGHQPGEGHDRPHALEQEEAPLPSVEREHGEHAGPDDVEHEINGRPGREQPQLVQPEAGEHEHGAGELDELEHSTFTVGLGAHRLLGSWDTIAVEELGLAELCDALQLRRLSVSEALDAVLRRADAIEPLHPFICRLDDEARRAAAASDARIANGTGRSMEGLPITVKDVIWMRSEERRVGKECR